MARDVLDHDRDRWVHTSAVAARAGEAGGVLPPQQRALLLAAAWLHDIGYAPYVRQTLTTTQVGSSGFHPLDGARYLTIHGWPAAVAALVAHHCGAVHVAEVLGMAKQVRAYRIAPQLQAVAEALTWADQTTGPAGQAWSMPERVSEMSRRLDPDSPTAQAHRHRLPDLVQAVARTEQRRRDLAWTQPIDNPSR